MSTRNKLITLVLTLAMTALVIAPASAFAAPVQSTRAARAVAVPVSGTNASGSFIGTATITKFVNQSGKLVAVGTLAGTLTNTATGAVSSILTTFSAPVAVTTATCEILDLTIGPIHLNLLGLTIDTNTITLDIDATSGPGNLLGNLLCGIAHLLDNPTALAATLNELLASLGL
jgi:hypothetical protein